MYGLKYGSELPPAVEKEMKSFLATLRAWVGTEHKEDGTHLEEAPHWTIGPWVIGGTDAFSDKAYVRLPYAIPTGTYHNFDPPGLSTAIVISIGATGGNLTFTGLRQDAREQRRLLIFRNEDNTSVITLNHEDANSLEHHRFRLPSGLNFTLTANESVWLLYDTKWQRWSTISRV